MSPQPNPTVTIHGANGVTAVWEVLPDGSQRLIREHPSPPADPARVPGPDGVYPCDRDATLPDLYAASGGS